MIKYLGSKRLLVPVLGEIAAATGARTALDLFTGTTRVAQEFKRRGMRVTACDVATYSEVLARCYISTDAAGTDLARLAAVLAELNALPGTDGYVTRTFCEESRYFRPENGRRIDAIRDRLESAHRDDPLFPVLLTSLLIAADRVDSTTGLQMAYLKKWAPRALGELDLKAPELISGVGTAVLGNATDLVATLPAVDLAYLDPPYNQHRYFTNYHVWETLVRWDDPVHYGVACKRADAREQRTKSAFNYKADMPPALRSVILRTRARMVLVSYNDESWMTADEITGSLREAGHESVEVLGFDSKRYVGAQIGIHNGHGVKVGQVGHLRNVEYLFLAGPRELVAAGMAAVSRTGPRTALAEST